MAIALARRYRPRRFSDLIVQDHVAAVLRGAVARGRVGHGYLLSGPRGVGKTTAARILAMALNCGRRAAADAGEPCGECDNCLRIWNGTADLDVVEIDAASNRGVDDARDLRERAMYAASREGHYKVYIVDEAHMLTREAWNALLKILEEPPPRVVFVFATTEPQKIAAAAAPVLSRLQRFDFRRIGPPAIRARLEQVLAAEGIGAEPDAITLIAGHADGGMRDALSLLDQCLSFGEGAVTAGRVREVLGLVHDELYADLLAVVADRNPAGVFALVERLVEAGADHAEFLNGAAEILRALLMLVVGAEPEGLTLRLRETLETFRSRFQAGDLLRMLRLLAEQENSVRRSANPRLLVETLLLRWTLLDRMVDLQQVLAGGSEGPPTRRAVPAAGPSPMMPPPRGGGGPVVSAASAPAATGAVAFELAAVRAIWPDVVAAARAERQILGEALGVTEPVRATPPDLVIRLLDANPLHRESLERHRALIEGLIGSRVGGPVRLVTEPGDGAAGSPGGEGAPRPRRMSESAARAERLRAARDTDPSVAAAAEGLDLEIVE